MWPLTLHVGSHVISWGPHIRLDLAEIHPSLLTFHQADLPPPPPPPCSGCLPIYLWISHPTLSLSFWGRPQRHPPTQLLIWLIWQWPLINSIGALWVIPTLYPSDSKLSPTPSTWPPMIVFFLRSHSMALAMSTAIPHAYNWLNVIPASS